MIKKSNIELTNKTCLSCSHANVCKHVKEFDKVLDGIPDIIIIQENEKLCERANLQLGC